MTSFSGNEFHMGTTLAAKKYFLIFDLDIGTISLNRWPRVDRYCEKTKKSSKFKDVRP